MQKDVLNKIKALSQENPNEILEVFVVQEGKILHSEIFSATELQCNISDFLEKLCGPYTSFLLNMEYVEVPIGEENEYLGQLKPGCSIVRYIRKELVLSDEQIARNDNIYNAVHDLCKLLVEKEDLEWDMNLIGTISELAMSELTKRGMRVRYPGVITTKDGDQYIEEYYGEKKRGQSVSDIQIGSLKNMLQKIKVDEKGRICDECKIIFCCAGAGEIRAFCNGVSNDALEKALRTSDRFVLDIHKGHCALSIQTYHGYMNKVGTMSGCQTCDELESFLEDVFNHFLQGRCLIYHIR